MLFFIAYEQDTNIIKGFYNTDVVKVIPMPNVELTEQEYYKAYDSITKGKTYTSPEGLTLRPMPSYRPPLTWDDVKFKRNSLLKNTDWSQLPDVSPSTAEKYASYRKLLRDIPQTYDTPDKVVWPTPPA